MPEISRFYGIIIKMYFTQKEHNPPHIHAQYGDCMSVIDIATGAVIEGDLPIRAAKLVLEWYSIYKDELRTMWEKKEFKKLPPLA